MFISSTWRKLRQFSVIAALSTTLSGCTFVFPAAELMASLSFPWPPDTPLLVASSSEVTVVHEEAGRLAVLHGETCGEADTDGREDFIRVAERLDFQNLLAEDATWITDATVFVNGWQGRFLDDPHSVRGIAAVLARISHERTILEFEVGGALSDPQFDAAYSICVTYTALAWNKAQLDISADDTDRENTFVLLDDDNPTVSSLNVLRNYREGLRFINVNTPSGVLPRGFGMALGIHEKLLQSAYSLGQSSPIRRADRVYTDRPQPNLDPGVIRQGGGGISWDSAMIMKSNDKVPSVYIGELVSIIGGNGLGYIQPPFHIEPANENLRSCGATTRDCGMAGLAFAS